LHTIKVDEELDPGYAERERQQNIVAQPVVTSDEESLSPANRRIEHENTFPSDDGRDSPLPVNQPHDITLDSPGDDGSPISPFDEPTLDATAQQHFPVSRKSLQSRGRTRAVSAAVGAPQMKSPQSLEGGAGREDLMDGDRFLESWRNLKSNSCGARTTRA